MGMLAAANFPCGHHCSCEVVPPAGRYEFPGRGESKPGEFDS